MSLIQEKVPPNKLDYANTWFNAWSVQVSIIVLWPFIFKDPMLLPQKSPILVFARLAWFHNTHIVIAKRNSDICVYVCLSSNVVKSLEAVSFLLVLSFLCRTCCHCGRRQRERGGHEALRAALSAACERYQWPSWHSSWQFEIFVCFWTHLLKDGWSSSRK